MFDKKNHTHTFFIKYERHNELRLIKKKQKVEIIKQKNSWRIYMFIDNERKLNF